MLSVFNFSLLNLSWNSSIQAFKLNPLHVTKTASFKVSKTFWTAKDKSFLSYHLICVSSISIIWYLIYSFFPGTLFFLGLEISITFLVFFLPHCYFQSHFLGSSCHQDSVLDHFSLSSFLNPSTAFNTMCWMSQIYISVLFSHKLHTCACNSLHDISTSSCYRNLCRCTSKQTKFAGLYDSSIFSS